MRLSYIDASECFYCGHELERELEYRKPMFAMFVVQYAQGVLGFLFLYFFSI
jgi:histidinol phosphatase-like enzyme